MEGDIRPTKYRACDATSAHRDSPEHFERYAGASIDRDQVKKGRTNHRPGLLRSVSWHECHQEAEQVLRELSALHLSLHRFFGAESVNHNRMVKSALLQSTPGRIRPELLGVIGEDISCTFASVGGGSELQIFMSPGYAEDRP